jgi:siroheme synthase
VALVRNASRADQETVVGSLDDIARRAEVTGIRPPALIVIGEVVSLYDPALAESMATFAFGPAPVSLPQAICS